MDGSNIRHTTILKAHQVKRLDVGTIVIMQDAWTGVCTRYRLIQYGRERRLQSLERPSVYVRIKNIPGNIYCVEG